METDRAAPQPPALQYMPDRQVAESRNLAFIVEGSDPRGAIPKIVAAPLPSDASLTDETTTNYATCDFDGIPATGPGPDQRRRHQHPALRPPTLQPGLNLVGHPMPPAGLSCFGWLNTIGSAAAKAIHRLEPTSGRWRGCAYTAADLKAAIGGDDFPILRGEGYRISSPAGGGLTLPGCE